MLMDPNKFLGLQKPRANIKSHFGTFLIIEFEYATLILWNIKKLAWPPVGWILIDNRRETKKSVQNFFMGVELIF